MVTNTVFQWLLWGFKDNVSLLIGSIVVLSLSLPKSIIANIMAFDSE
jgi:hypothetical protein